MLLEKSGTVSLPPSLILVLAAVSFFFTLVPSYVLLALGFLPPTLLALAAIVLFFLGVPLDGPPYLYFPPLPLLALAVASLPLSLLV